MAAIPPTPVPDSAAVPSGMSRRYYWFLILYMVGMSMYGSFVNDMYTPALPELCRFFSCSVATVQLGMTTALCGAAIGQMVMGPVSDHFGRRPVLWFALALGMCAAFFSIFSKTITVFLIFRFLQGLGGSGGYFLARAIPTDLFHGRRLAMFMATIGAINGIAPASAPVIGGFVSDAFTWKGVFVVLAATAAVLLFASPAFKESLAPAARLPLSLKASARGYRDLLHRKSYMIHVMLKGWTLALMFVYISSAPFILETHYGLSESTFGIVIGVNALFMAGGSMVSLKFKPLKRSAFVGALVLAAGVALQCVALWFIHNFWVYEILLVPMTFSMGMIFATSNTLAMNEGRDRAGEAAAVLGTVGYIMGGLATPLVGLGDVLHSTAVVFAVLTVFILIAAYRTRRQPADLDK